METRKRDLGRGLEGGGGDRGRGLERGGGLTAAACDDMLGCAKFFRTHVRLPLPLSLPPSLLHRDVYVQNSQGEYEPDAQVCLTSPTTAKRALLLPKEP
jgi:hypothetical protein